MTRVSTALEVSGAAQMRRPALRRGTMVLAGLVLLALACAASLVLGARVADWPELAGGLTGQINGVGEAAVAARIPRTVMAVLVGAMLAVAGGSMQAVTRNPLADPGILGVSLGASLAVVLGIAFFAISAPLTFTALSIIGAGATASFVYVLGSLGGATPLKLAVVGAATAAACAALVGAVLLPRVDILTTFRHWQVGGVGGAGWDRILIALPFAAIGIALCLGLARNFNALALGDEAATGLGVRVGMSRILGWGGAVILCGAATSVVGPIAFVGLIVPHMVRLIVGPDYRWVLPLSVLCGAILLLVADVLGRVISRPSEIEVGIVVAFIGAPFFVWLVRRHKVRDL